MGAIIVGTTAVVAIPSNKRRVGVRFQNGGSTLLYLAKSPLMPTLLDYDIMLYTPTFGEITSSYINTNSTAQFNVVSSDVNGILSIFETIKI